MKRYILILFLFSISYLAYAAQTCTTSKIGIGSNDFRGISGSSTSNIIAVGKNGIVYTYNGTSWSSSSSGTNQDLRSVFTLNSTTAFAVGENGTIRIYNGTTWAGSSSGTSEDLRGVWAYSSTDVYAVGKNGIVLHYDGATWSNLSSAANTGSVDLQAVWGNSSTLYALGKNGNLYAYNRSGGTWSTITTCASALSNDANALWGDSSGNIYLAVDGGAVYKYNGSTCTQVATASEDLLSIFGSNTTGEIYAVGKDGKIVYYNGSSWVTTSQGSRDINAVWVSSTGNAYYGIDQGYISTCTYAAGGGGSGSTCATTTVSSRDLNGISGSSKTDVLGVGKNGEVWAYDGSNWVAVTVTGSTGEDLEDVYAIDSTNSVAVGDNGSVLLETNGTWSTLTAPTGRDLRGVWAYSTSEIYVFGKEGVIYSYNGSSWTSLGSSAGTNSNDKFEDAWGNSTYVYGLTEKGSLFRYTRSGGAWTEITTCAVGGNVQFDDLWGDTSGNIYLAGKNNSNGVVYKYNGTTCSLVATASDDLKGIYGSTTTGEIYAVGKSGYYQYYNGTIWTESRQGTQDLNDVWVASDGTPFYSGDSGTLTTCAVTSALNNFLISHDGNGINCQAETITITARDSSNATVTGYTGTIALSTSTGHGTWAFISGSGTLTDSISDDGAATFQFNSSGSVVLSLTNTHAEALTITAAEGSITDISNTLTYRPNGFNMSPSPIGTQVAGKPFDTILTAVGNPATATGCTTITEYTGSKSLSWWADYNNPAINPDSTKVTKVNVNGASVGINETAATSLSITFTNGVSTAIPVIYSDAGQITLNVKDTVGIGEPSGTGNEIVVGGSAFVVRPFGFDIDFTDDRATNGITGPSYAADQNGSVFKKAGENFLATLTAVVWQSADDLNSDGIPDTGVSLADNATAINFGRELSAVVPSDVSLTQTLVAPVGGANGTLTTTANSVSFIDGAGTATLNWNEVGIITISASLSDYLSAGQSVTGSVVNVGRFYPDHFCASSGSILNRTDANSKASCTDGFSYLSEDFTNTFTLIAQKNAAACGDGTSTLNYTSTFSKFDTIALLSGDNTTDATETGTLNFAALDTASVTNLSSRINFNTAASTSSGEFTNGSLAVTAKMDIARSGSAPNYTAETAFTAVNLGIKPIDTDGITLATTNLTINSANYFNVGNTALYFGRLYADSTFGTEQEGLPMWAEPQYCNAQSSGVCSDWKTKTDDTCSLYSVTPPADTALGNTVAGDGQGYWTTATTNYTETTGKVLTTDSLGHKAGWRIWYTDLPAGKGGTYTIPFVTHPYLITQDGSASFGLYRGDDRIIYWREIFN